jgi:signal transduction histidine kinase
MIPELSVDDVLINEQLALRPVHVPSAEAEMRSLRLLVQKFSTDSMELMNATVESVCTLCGADSAGITVAETHSDGSETLRWIATAGRIQELGLQALPREYSPCGTVLDRRSPQLFSYPGRYFTYIENSWDVVELLLVPWEVGSTIRGTLWAVMQNNSKQFDREDLRMLQMLVLFAGTAVARNEMENSRRSQESIASAARMANDLAHAMNNPLQALTNALYLVDAGSEAHLEDAKRELQRLSRLVAEILELNSQPAA